MSSPKLGELRNHPTQNTDEIKDSTKIAKISVTYDDNYVTSLRFLDRTGEQIGSTIGKPNGGGKEGTLTEEFIGLKPGEVIAGI